MVVARTVPARQGLVERFAAHDIDRAYLAIARGRVASRSYETLHGRHPGDRKKFSSKVKRGRRAVTHVTAVEALHGATLIRCRLETGRTHQIRVHLADDGHPLLGDPLYGRAPRDPRLREAARKLGRQALHAARLGFVHPVTGEALTFEVEPPEDFHEALEALRGE
jgi:23S rRNA pseudouridine1911/1915/1917 synthase